MSSAFKQSPTLTDNYYKKLQIINSGLFISVTCKPKKSNTPFVISLKRLAKVIDFDPRRCVQFGNSGNISVYGTEPSIINPPLGIRVLIILMGLQFRNLFDNIYIISQISKNKYAILVHTNLETSDPKKMRAQQQWTAILDTRKPHNILDTYKLPPKFR